MCILNEKRCNNFFYPSIFSSISTINSQTQKIKNIKKVEKLKIFFIPKQPDIFNLKTLKP